MEDHDEDHDEDHHEGDEEVETTFYDKSKNNYSFAINIGRDLNEFLSFDFGLARVERAPSVVELFMNGPHLSTGRYEVGNTDLSSEESTNFDLSLNYINDGFYGELTLFRNDVDNYIYLMDETEEEHEEHEEEGHDDHGGLILANYLQQNAELEGYEFQIGRTIELDTGLLDLSFGRDGVEGTFNDGTNIPRLNPARNIYRLTYEQDDINFKLLLKDVKKQNDIGVGETSTAGYQMLDFKLTKTFELQYWSLSKDVKSKFQVSLFGRNLLDEVARNHSSFVKSEVPLPGRNYGIKFNLVF
jgi:iron complex outermembrane receptor protein